MKTIVIQKKCFDIKNLLSSVCMSFFLASFMKKKELPKLWKLKEYGMIYTSWQLSIMTYTCLVWRKWQQSKVIHFSQVTHYAPGDPTKLISLLLCIQNIVCLIENTQRVPGENPDQFFSIKLFGNAAYST